MVGKVGTKLNIFALGSTSNAKEEEYLSTLLGATLSIKSDPLNPDWTKDYRAKYYLEIGAKKNFDCLPSEVPKVKKLICMLYANNMRRLGMREYDGYMYEIPGFSFLPKIRYWGNEAENDNIMSTVLGPNDYGNGGRTETHCANCNCMASPGTKFKHCVRCKAAWCKYSKRFCLHACWHSY